MGDAGILELPILPHVLDITRNFSVKGDSGSLIGTPSGKLVGLLAGGAAPVSASFRELSGLALP